MSSFLARPSLTRARSMSIGCQSRRELLWPCRPSLSSRTQASARPIFSQSLVMVSLPSSVNCSKKPSPGIILAWRLTLGPAMHGQRRVWHTYRLVAGSEWGCPALPPSFFGKKFWRVSWLFLKFSKVFGQHQPIHHHVSLNSSTKCGCRLGVVDTGRPSSVCQREAKKF